MNRRNTTGSTRQRPNRTTYGLNSCKTRGVGTPFIFAFALLQVVVFMTRFPAFRALSPVTRMGITFVLLTVVLATVAISALRIAMGSRQELRPGDEHYDMVHALAGRAGVMVRHVVLVRSPSLNAFASVFGTLGLTTALVRRMSASELEAVVAHELGHLHAGHARSRGAWSYCVSGEECLHIDHAVGARAGRQGGEERAPVAFGPQATVEDRDDAAIRGRAEEATKALLETHLGLRQ